MVFSNSAHIVMEESMKINPIPVIFIILILALAIIGRGLNLLVGNLESIPEPKPISTASSEPATEGVNNDINSKSLRSQFPGVWSEAPIDDSRDTVSFRASHYYPPAGGPNCSAFYDGYCHSKLASGERWEEWMGAAVAMPADIPFWSILVITEPAEIRGRYIVLDRGGAIVTKDGIPWVDFLWDLETWTVPFGTIIEGYILPPGSVEEYSK
jgi:hypothetical protein